jgi:hypothetical protein
VDILRAEKPAEKNLPSVRYAHCAPRFARPMRCALRAQTFYRGASPTPPWRPTAFKGIRCADNLFFSGLLNASIAPMAALSIENAVQLVLFSIDSAAISAKIHLAEAGKKPGRIQTTPWLSPYYNIPRMAKAETP